MRSSIIIIAILILGCTCGSAPAPASPDPAVPVPSDTPRDATIQDDASVIPDELASATAWAGRILDTGEILPQAVHTRATLQRVGDRALVTREIREAPTRPGGGDLSWGPPTTLRHVGTFDDKRLSYVDRGQPVALDCATMTVVVAAATAVRRREGKAGCMGDRGKWVPGATHEVKVLVCGEMTKELAPRFVFVEPPAREIEYVWINDDCVMQGGGYRDVPLDGSIASPR
jgi:hypothetical protein